MGSPPSSHPSHPSHGAPQVSQASQGSQGPQVSQGSYGSHYSSQGSQGPPSSPSLASLASGGRGSLGSYDRDSMNDPGGVKSVGMAPGLNGDQDTASHMNLPPPSKRAVSGEKWVPFSKEDLADRGGVHNYPTPVRESLLSRGQDNRHTMTSSKGRADVEGASDVFYNRGSTSSSVQVGRTQDKDKGIFFDFEPDEFKRIRDHFGINPESYIRSFKKTAKERLTEGGSSGAFFFYSGTVPLSLVPARVMLDSTRCFQCSFIPRLIQNSHNYTCHGVVVSWCRV